MFDMEFYCVRPQRMRVTAVHGFASGGAWNEYAVINTRRALETRRMRPGCETDPTAAHGHTSVIAQP